MGMSHVYEVWNEEGCSNNMVGIKRKREEGGEVIGPKGALGFQKLPGVDFLKSCPGLMHPLS